MHVLTLNPCHAGAPSVVTIGNFDGLHLGHQQLLKAVQDQATAMDAVSTVILFEPQPLEFLRADKAPPRLMSLSEKLYGLQQLGIQRVGIIRFNRHFAALTAIDFVRHILLDQLQAVAVWVGDDFRFGKDRQGNFSLLTDLAKQYQFRVAQTPCFQLHGRRLASTWLREALADANMALAEQILGHPYTIRGRVVHGQKLGRTIGFPTLNILFKHLPAVTGVFVVRVLGLAEQPRLGVANIGVRPTVSGLQHRLEVHIFDWQGNAYGKKVDVLLLHQLREEKKFHSIEELKLNIQKDADDARRFLSL